MKKVILIVYTTRYRKGGNQFRRVAETMASEKSNDHLEILCQPVESKTELKDLFLTIKSDSKYIQEFHFIGHSGMYGPMFGTVSYPEQFSPYELRHLEIPFSDEATATFHCCRSARWFAPYFSRVQKVKSFGYHWYTTFSARKDRYQLPYNQNAGKLYCFGCPGKKSHGIYASFKKLAGAIEAEKLKEFSQLNDDIDSSYDKVAKLYAETFQDIKVRRDEFKWLSDHIPNNKSIRLLDIGCGNGALLNELEPQITSGIGVDISENLLKHAETLNKNNKKITFQKIDGPKLPFENDSFDVVVSLLSFRYLDWDPIMSEIERVLATDGKLLIIDMVTAPIRWFEIPLFLKSKVKHYYQRYKYAFFYQNLQRLVNNPNWSNMLTYNPIRSQHEMKWYLESRFPSRKVEIINIGLHSRIIAFDSINMKNTNNTKLSYP